MSAEKINSKKNILTATMTPEDSEEQHSGRVDINHLLARVRKQKNKETKINIVLFGLFASVLLIVGIILSF